MSINTAALTLTTALMKGADANHSGGLSVQEFAKVAKVFAGGSTPTASQTQAVFATLDSNKDGQLGLSELAQATVTGNTLSPQAQFQVQAYQTLIGQLGGTSTGMAGLYASLSQGTATLTEGLVGGMLGAKGILA